MLGDRASHDAGLFFNPRDRRHLLGLDGMPREEILEILDRAEVYRHNLSIERFASDELTGVTVLNAFLEDSTRTRVSFEVAERRLGALPVSFSTNGSSMSKGESLLDTFRTVAAMGIDLIVVRHPGAGAPSTLARHLQVPIINAGDGVHEHPTQGLLDIMTLRQAWHDRFEGRRIAIIGDIAHSRVARSAMFGLTTLGTTVTVAGPPGLIPSGVEGLGCRVAHSLEEAMTGADAVMALRLQRERMDHGLVPSLGEYAQVWGISADRLRLLKADAVVLHPGPLNRDVEIAAEVADGERSVILRQVTNGVAVRCAVLSRCARRKSQG